MLKIKPRSHYKELTAVFALMLGISGGATIALNNQPGYQPIPRPGNVAGVSTDTESKVEMTKQSTAQAQVDQAMAYRSAQAAQHTSSTSTPPTPSSSSSPTPAASVTVPDSSTPGMGGGSTPSSSLPTSSTPTSPSTSTQPPTTDPQQTCTNGQTIDTLTGLCVDLPVLPNLGL